MCIHSLRQHTDVAITYENGALLDICRSNLDIVRWTMARSRKYAADQPKFWKNIKLERNNVDAQYIYIGVKAFNYFMPRETLSLKGPGGGGFDSHEQYLQVMTRYMGAVKRHRHASNLVWQRP